MTSLGGGEGPQMEGGEGSSRAYQQRPCKIEMVDQGSVESHRYFLARRTLLEMLRDRGYDVPASELNRTLAQFRDEFGDNPTDLERLRLSFSLLSHPSKKVLVVIMGKDEIRKPTIRALYGQLLNGGSLDGLILVLQSKMNHFARKALDGFPFKVEIFEIADLLVNITKHVQQPKHEILTAKQKKELLKTYKIEDKQLPKMLKTDALVHYHGLEKGHVIKSTYGGGIVESLVTYRCVI